VAERYVLLKSCLKKLTGLADRYLVVQSRTPLLVYYARKQLLLSARLSHRNSVCLSLCLSHGWISQKRYKLRSPNLHRWLPGKLQFQEP